VSLTGFTLKRKKHLNVSSGEALLFESTLAVIKPPPKRTFDAIYHASTRFNETENRRDTIFSGCSAELYSTDDDLVLLKQPAYEDRLTLFVQRYLPVIFAVRPPPISCKTTYVY
jgi:hypothetical protein